MKNIFTLVGVVFIAISANAQIIISEVYTAAGNSASAFKNDYIVLKNIGSETASLSNATIQYATASGSFTQYHALPSITLNPGQSYLIQEYTSENGDLSIPAPDFIAGKIINFNGSENNLNGLDLTVDSGKIVLANNTIQVTDPKSANVLDFVGYGSSANQFLGTAPAQSPTADMAVKRIFDENNKLVFALGSPSPMNSKNGNFAISDTDVDYSKFNFIVNSFIKDNNEVVFGGSVENVKIYNEYGKVVLESPTKIADRLNLIELPKGKYTVTGTINNSPVSQQIVKD